MVLVRNKNKSKLKRFRIQKSKLKVTFGSISDEHENLLLFHSFFTYSQHEISYLTPHYLKDKT